MDICPKCGLPLQACVCKEISREKQEIKITTEKRRFGKVNTIIKGISNEDIKSIAKELKTYFACGGTVKNKTIELQGNHKNKIKPFLVSKGFDENQIKD